MVIWTKSKRTAVYSQGTVPKDDAQIDNAQRFFLITDHRADKAILGLMMVFPSLPSEMLSLVFRGCCCDLTTLFLASFAHTQSKSGSHVSVSMRPVVEPPCLCNTISCVPIRLKDNQAKMFKHYQERNNCSRIAVSNTGGRDTGQITEKEG